MTNFIIITFIVLLSIVAASLLDILSTIDVPLIVPIVIVLLFREMRI